MTTKPDATEIANFMRKLARAPWLGSVRASWPLHLFRIDDVRAAATILNDGVIHSRVRAQQLGVLDHDSAAPAIIEHSPDWCKICVRLYFRPKTPTEYRSEGFRPRAELQIGAHRPMPVVMVFDSIPVLTAAGTQFTDGNAAASNCRRGQDAEFLRSIPFESVYHVGGIMEGQVRDIVFRRCAEVLVEGEMALTHLKRIFCRSQGEYETLIELLSKEAQARHSKQLGVSAGMHYREWTFVESAALSRTRVHLRFNRSSCTPGPFEAEVKILVDDQEAGSWRDESYIANSELNLSLEDIGPLSTYRVVFTLDGALAYANTFRGEEVLV